MSHSTHEDENLAFGMLKTRKNNSTVGHISQKVNGLTWLEIHVQQNDTAIPENVKYIYDAWYLTGW